MDQFDFWHADEELRNIKYGQKSDLYIKSNWVTQHGY